MRHSQAEKMAVIRNVQDSELSVRRTPRELGINRSTFYGWYKRYLEDGYDGLAPAEPRRHRCSNKIPPDIRELVVRTARENADLSRRELACLITDRLSS